MEGRADSGIEIRRILLLTRLQKTPKGLTMNQLVGDCSKVDGWNILGTGLWEGVRIVLQSLINDGLVEVERKLFWNSIYAIFDKALTRLRARSQPSSRKE